MYNLVGNLNLLACLCNQNDKIRDYIIIRRSGRDGDTQSNGGIKTSGTKKKEKLRITTAPFLLNLKHNCISDCKQTLVGAFALLCGDNHLHPPEPFLVGHQWLGDFELAKAPIDIRPEARVPITHQSIGNLIGGSDLAVRYVARL